MDIASVLQERSRQEAENTDSPLGQGDDEGESRSRCLLSVDADFQIIPSSVDPAATLFVTRSPNTGQALQLVGGATRVLALAFRACALS